jgi:hypothetical protein
MMQSRPPNRHPSGMCGRYAQYLPPEAIVRLFHALNATTNHAISATNALFGSVQSNGAMH